MSTKAASFKLCILLSLILNLAIDSSLADVEQLTQDNFDSFITANQYVLVLFSEYDCEFSTYCDV